MKTKILFLSQDLNLGGSQLNLKNIIQGLTGNDYHFSVWAPFSGELENYYRKNNINVIIKDFYVDKVNREAELVFSKSTDKKIKKFIKKYKKSGKKVAIRCAGNISSKLLAEYDFSEISLIGLFDGNPALFGSRINGVEVYPADKINEFDVDVVLIAHTHPKYFKDEIKKKIKIIDNFFVESRLSRSLNLTKFYLNLVEPLNLFLRINPDIIFINNIRSFWAVIAGKLLRKKVIWAIHECFDPRTFKAFPQSLFLRSFKMADKFIFPSRAAYDLFRDFIPESKVNIIYNGIDITAIEEYKSNISPENLRKELAIPPSHKVICNLGTIDQIKGQLYLVKAGLNLLKKSKDKNYTFILVGAKPNSYLDEITKLIDESGFNDNFHIIPVTKEPFKYLSMADLYVCSSIKESFGISLLEAMAFNIPIIATNTYAIPEIISDNHTGLLIPLSDMEKHIEDKVESLLSDAEKMNCLRNNAYGKLLAQFTLEIEIEKYNKVIKNCC